MTLWTGQELNQIFSSHLPENLTISGISIDTRTLNPGDLFVALNGEGRDGHEFLNQAVKAGAAAVMVHQDIPGFSLPQIVVNDTLSGLILLGQTARQRTKACIIAITGSVGKTSTKEILAQVLARFGTVSYAHASYNNHWGVPLSLARMARDVDWAILEIGMNNPGEIAPLAQLVKPDIAIITTIAPAHIGHMKSLQTIAKEKAQIFQGLQPGGVAIIPCDIPDYDILAATAQQCGAQTILTVGQKKGADFSCIQYQDQHSGQGCLITIDAMGHHFNCSLSLRGEHFAHIALIIYSVAYVLQLDLKNIGSALSQAKAVKGRGQHHQLTINGKPIYLVDDAYNANLTSMLAGLKVLTSLTPQHNGRRIAVVGEMLELGNFAEEHHCQMAQFLIDQPIDKVFATGGVAMKQGYYVLPEHLRGGYTSQAQDLVPILLEDLQPNDVIYVKGSKGSRVSLVVDALLTQSNGSKISENIQ
jgi:UDP-N-acetylmuramoyl-tripeptide--D-alanyl-D-alanine ligase